MRALLLGALAIAGCGGGIKAAAPRATPTTTPEPPAALAGCTGIHAQWREIKPGGVDAATTGSGSAVVFANQSGNSACAWVPLAERLAKDHTVAVFDYNATGAGNERDCVNEALAVAKAAGTPYVLVGASLGGRVVIEAAARHPPGLKAIVSLSGERFVQSYRDIIASARQVKVPVLYAGARQDGFTDGARQQDQLHSAMGGTLIQIGGLDHGTDLLAHPRISNDVSDFVSRWTAG